MLGRFAVLESTDSKFKLTGQREKDDVVTLLVVCDDGPNHLNVCLHFPKVAWDWFVKEIEKDSPLAASDTARAIRNDLGQIVEQALAERARCCLLEGAGSYVCGEHGPVPLEMQVFTSPDSYVAHCYECHASNWVGMTSYSGALPVFVYPPAKKPA